MLYSICRTELINPAHNKLAPSGLYKGANISKQGSSGALLEAAYLTALLLLFIFWTIQMQ